MESRREPWLINHLEIAFRDTEVKRAYQDTSHRAISSQLTNRVFDHFNTLLPTHELTQIAKKFITLLRDIKLFTTSDGETANLESTHQISLANELMNDIINIGIFELFNEQKQLRPELIKLLNWEEFTTTINYSRLLTAYIGSVFQSIYITFPKSLEELAPARECAERYINQNYRNQAVTALLQRGFITQGSADAELKPSLRDTHTPASPPARATLLTGSLAALAGLAFGIYAAIGNTRQRWASIPNNSLQEQSTESKPNK